MSRSERMSHLRDHTKEEVRQINPSILATASVGSYLLYGENVHDPPKPLKPLSRYSTYRLAQSKFHFSPFQNHPHPHLQDNCLHSTCEASSLHTNL